LSRNSPWTRYDDELIIARDVVGLLIAINEKYLAAASHCGVSAATLKEFHRFFVFLKFLQQSTTIRIRLRPDETFSRWMH
jgi:hypothetical protein